MVPTAQLDLGDVLTDSGVTDPVAIAGVQDKASARTIALPVHSQGADAILKISQPEFPALVENESACFGIGRRNRLRIPCAGTEQIADEAVHLTGDAAETIITATGFDPRRARDLRWVLAHRRRHWES